MSTPFPEIAPGDVWGQQLIDIITEHLAEAKAYTDAALAAEPWLAPANAFPDPEFNNPALPGWAATSGTLSHVSTGGHTGPNAMKVTGPSPVVQLVGGTSGLPVAADTWYRFGAWFYTDAAAPITVTATIDSYDEAGAFLYADASSGDVVEPGVWTFIVCAAYRNTDGPGFMSPGFASDDTTGAALYVDSLEMPIYFPAS